ncbi:MAG: ChaN family lipoprotein [Bacteroidota bacterium]
MHITKHFLLCLLIFLLCSFSDDRPAYRIFQSGRSNTGWKDLVSEAAKADVVLFGEMHNVSVVHWLELQLAKDLFAKRGNSLVLGAEMLETDNQLPLTEYLGGKMSAKQFESEVKLWNNYKTDYKPLVDFAKDNALPFVATNIPRRYASLVSREDVASLEKLDQSARALMMPLPFQPDLSLPGYKKMTDEMSAHAGGDASLIAKAQAVKDATMATFILNNLKPGQIFLHYNGSYHSDNFEGIAYYLKKQKPGIKILTISSVEQADINKEIKENTKLADFVLAIPEDMAKSY